MLYFDHNATSPMLPEARRVWLEASEQYIGNPSSPHRLGARADAVLQTARDTLARFLGGDASDIVWTSGATESNNMVFHHLLEGLPANAEVWVSAIEHPGVLRAAAHRFPKRCRLIPVLKTGVVDLEWLRRELARKSPGLVAVMAANNETGVLQPWRQVLALCREWDVPFFCDAAQWIGKLPAAGLGQCDFVSGSAHKFGGSQGVGFLKCPARGNFHPLLLGGPQEDSRRAGTENVAGVLTMVAALEARERMLSASEHQRRLGWRTSFEQAVLQKLPGVELIGASADRLWNTVAALMPAHGSQQRWVVKLDKAGYAVSTGSACASGREEPSHVLAAMGYGRQDASRMLRFSGGWETAEADWRQLAEGLQEVHSGLKW